ncbi:MAG: alpha/beta fold hydrolase, partial [Cyanobacteria bacterium]|nr:alpha/beta fold hydrolase [Cyanobacteriota bacterium]
GEDVVSSGGKVDESSGQESPLGKNNADESTSSASGEDKDSVNTKSSSSNEKSTEKNDAENADSRTAETSKEEEHKKSDTSLSETDGSTDTGSTRSSSEKPEFIPIVSWRESDVTSWATLLCIHGLGLHKFVYAPFAKRMARAGVTTYAIDVHGFGSWDNTDYGKTLDLKKSLLEIEKVVKALRECNPGRPVILLGESMGGAIVLQSAARNPDLIDGVIACVPSGMRYKQKSDRMKTAVGLIRGANKRMDVGPGLVQRATEDESLQEKWLSDPKARTVLSPRELITFQSFMNRTSAEASKITKLPVLMVQGGQDRLVKAKGTEDLFKLVGSEDKDFVMLGKSEHLIFEEGQFDEQVVNVVTSWILKHVISSRLSNGSSADEANDSEIHDPILARRFDPRTQEMATGHYFLGQGYLRLDQPTPAREHFLEVLKLAPGSLLSREADSLLSTALKEQGDDDDEEQLAKVEPKFISPQMAFGNDNPTLLSFYTTWQFKRDDIWKALKHIQLRYSGSLNMVRVDVDDPKNQDLVRHYKVCAVPTFFFLDSKNNVIDEKLGCVEEKDIIFGINEIISNRAASR